MANFEDTLARMHFLMGYKAPINESKTGVEYSAEGADGKRYGIIKEGTKFYIKYSDKSAPNIAESYNYINGIMAKKENEFNSYNAAEKHLETKLISLNEAYNAKMKTSSFEYNKTEKVFTNLTEAARTELNRMHQILENSMNIGKDNVGLPEAPKTAKFNAEIGKPFDNTAKAELDKDMKKTAADPKAQGEPFDKEEKCCDVDMQGDKGPKCLKKCDGSEPAKFVPKGAVAAKKPAGGLKPVKMNEDVSVDPTEDDNLLGFEDETEPTDVDVSDFDTEEVSDESLNDMFADDETLPSDDEVEMPEDDENVADDENVYDIDVEDDNFDDQYQDMPMESKRSLKRIVEGVCKNLKSEMKKQALTESLENQIDSLVKEEVTKLNAFGKHPGYRKKPMTMPSNKEVLKWGTRSWDDDSVKSDEPFGKKIGSSFPFDKKVDIDKKVSVLTDQVLKSIKENLKKK